MDNNQIIQLVCTRLSHDIIGNIGAVANAVELLEEGDLDFLDDIKSILKNSSQTLASRMKFFRMAFGLNNSNLDNLDLVRNTALDYIKTITNKDFPILLTFDVNSANNRKIALIMIMIMADLLIRGGSIDIYEQENYLIASINANAKIAIDKLQKIESAIYNKNYDIDAGLAPLYALMQTVLPNHVKLCKDDKKITLTAVVG